MPSEKPTRRLEDIIENAQTIRKYTAGMDLSAFEKDGKTVDAVERCLERISEAAAKLIRKDRLWDIVQNDLPTLRAACERALLHVRNNEPQIP